MFSQVLNHVESAIEAGPMACAASAFAMGASVTASPFSVSPLAAGRRTAGVQASSGKTGRTHQVGETVTRMVITNLVRPETTRETAKTRSKTSLFAPGVVGSSWPQPDRPLGFSHTPFASVVRSRPGPSMPAPAGHLSVVRVRCSSTNPNP